MKRTPRDRSGGEKILAAKDLSNAEARFLVSSYYAAQEMRKRLDLQRRHLVGAHVEDEEKKLPVDILLDWGARGFAEIETVFDKAFEVYAESSRIGQWCLSQVGVGPVITTGLLAHLDISKAPTSGHFNSFAGLNPDMVWERGQKRPYNAELKQICYHLGECFKRTSNPERHPDAYYGQIYRAKKREIVERNERGCNAERAKTFTTKSNDVRKLLKKGMLPAGNLDRQACNQTVKIFLSHLHALMYWDTFSKIPPKPYAIAILKHGHEIAVPDSERLFPGFWEAYYGRREAAE